MNKNAVIIKNLINALKIKITLGKNCFGYVKANDLLDFLNEVEKQMEYKVAE